MTYLTYALWGRGDLTPENAKALLEEYIPDNVGTVYRPEVVDRQHQGLRNALAWFESPEFLGEGGAVPTTDIVQSLVADRDNNGDEVYLLALWPAEQTHEEFDFIELAQRSGITVFDLSRALDELDLSLYSRPDPTKEEKAEARAAVAEEKRGRGRPRKKLSDEAPKEEANGAVYMGTTGSLPAETPVPAEVSVPAPRPEVKDLKAAVLEEMFQGSTADALIAALDTYIESKIVEVLARRTTAPAEDTAAHEQDMTTDRPPFEGPFVGTDTKPYFKAKDGSLRPAVGKPRRGEIVINLTQADIDGLGLDQQEPPF